MLRNVIRIEAKLYMYGKKNKKLYLLFLKLRNKFKKENNNNNNN